MDLSHIRHLGDEQGPGWSPNPPLRKVYDMDANARTTVDATLPPKSLGTKLSDLDADNIEDSQSMIEEPQERSSCTSLCTIDSGIDIPAIPRPPSVDFLFGDPSLGLDYLDDPFADLIDSASSEVACQWPLNSEADHRVLPRKFDAASSPDADSCLVQDESDEVQRDDAESQPSDVSVSDSSDRDSSWMSASSEDIPALEEGHPFEIARPDAVRRALLAFESWNQRPPGSEASSANGSSLFSADSQASTAPSSSHTISSKRKRSDSDENGEGTQPPPKRSRSSKQSAVREVSLACPFAKKDPLRYRGCYAYTIKRIQDVKQHLSRYHQLPIYCRRCKMLFDTDELLNVHAETTICPSRSSPVYEGLTRTHKDQLARRVSAKMTLEAQWFTIFDVLFPGHQPRPMSAFVNADLTFELELFRDMMVTEGPRIISESLQSSGITIHPVNEEHDLSTLLQSVISEGLVNIVERFIASLPSVQSQERNSQGGSTTATSSHPSSSARQSTDSARTSGEGRNVIHRDAPSRALTMGEDGPNRPDYTQANELPQNVSATLDEALRQEPASAGNAEELVLSNFDNSRQATFVGLRVDQSDGFLTEFLPVQGWDNFFYQSNMEAPL